MNISPLVMTDFYKTGHHFQYPAGTNKVFSNMTARKSRIPNVDKIVFFGLQYFLKEYLEKQWSENFFNKTKEEVVAKYKRRIETSLGPNAITYEHIEALHSLGYLPIEIMALPEGSLVEIGIPPFVIYNTMYGFGWVTNYLETIMSLIVWGPITSATTAHQYRKLINRYADETVGNRDFVSWQGHDFSMRGMMGLEAACLSGAAHLLSFTGTDTIPAIDFLEEYYGADCEKELIGGSVPASEHSVASLSIINNTDGDKSEEAMEEAEYQFVKRMITETYPTGIVSLVSDTFHFWRVVTKVLPRLKNEIMARNGKVVIRPDSGDPTKIICGDPNAPIGSPERKGLIECLWDTFGGTLTEKGYKLLDSHIGAIYGDSITLERCEAILEGLKKKKFCASNIVFGIGSYTYSYVTRDTYGLAVKATYGEVNGTARNIFKDPKTDDGTKRSAKGLLAVYQKKDDIKAGFMLVEEANWYQVSHCEYKQVFNNGRTYNIQTLSQIRARLASFGDN